MNDFRTKILHAVRDCLYSKMPDQGLVKTELVGNEYFPIKYTDEVILGTLDFFDTNPVRINYTQPHSDITPVKLRLTIDKATTETITIQGTDFNSNSLEDAMIPIQKDKILDLAPAEKETEFSFKTISGLIASGPITGKVTFSAIVDNTIRTPNPGYNTPLWRVELRPVTPEDCNQPDFHLFPSCFLRVTSGKRSATGQGLQNSPVIGAIGEITEDYEVWIQGVFNNKYGAENISKRKIPTDSTKSLQKEAKQLSEQINGFIHDLDKLLNVYTLRVDLGPNADVIDAYVADWSVVQAMEGSPDEIVIAQLIVTINYDRNLQ